MNQRSVLRKSVPSNGTHRVSSIVLKQISRGSKHTSFWVGAAVLLLTFAVGFVARLQASGDDLIYLSTSYQGSEGGVAFTRDDIITYDIATDTWALYFDGSDVGVPIDANVSGFAKLDDGSLLFTFLADNITLPDVGLVDASDIVRFVPTSVGETTSGSFEMYFDGSDVEIADTSNGIIDAVAVLADGRLLISTLGGGNVTGAAWYKDEDLLEFTPSQLGSTTSGTWALYYDGSDNGMTDGGDDEDVRAAWSDPLNDELYLSTKGNFTIPGLSGDRSDIFICTPASLGTTTSCTNSMYWDGSTHGLTLRINALHIERAAATPTATATATGAATATSTPTATATIVATATATPTGQPVNTPTPTATATAVSNGRVSDSLQTLYTFREEGESTVNDVSGVGAPLDLTIADTNAVTWLSGGGLQVNTGSAKTIIESAGAADKVIASSMSSDAISVEAWVQPANTTQAGPARIVTISGDPSNRNMTMGQGYWGSTATDLFSVRLRTTTNNLNGSDPNVLTDAGSATTNLTHVVYTRDAAGDVQLYIDGTLVNGTMYAGSTPLTGDPVVDGSFTGSGGWDTGYKFGLADEFNSTSGRSWAGTYYLVAVYSKALTAIEVSQNYDAGHLPTTTTNAPPIAVDDAVTTSSWVPVVIDVLANDSDPDGDSITVGDFTQPTNGSVILDFFNHFTYSPAPGFTGTDSFTYEAIELQTTDQKATIATVTITVAPNGDYLFYDDFNRSNNEYIWNNWTEANELHEEVTTPAGANIGIGRLEILDNQLAFVYQKHSNASQDPQDVNGRPLAYAPLASDLLFPATFEFAFKPHADERIQHEIGIMSLAAGFADTQIFDSTLNYSIPNYGLSLFLGRSNKNLNNSAVQVYQTNFTDRVLLGEFPLDFQFEGNETYTIQADLLADHIEIEVSNGTTSQTFITAAYDTTLFDSAYPLDHVFLTDIQGGVSSVTTGSDVYPLGFDDISLIAADWQQVPTTNNPDVWGEYAMAYDSSRDVTVLYGGNGNGWPYENNTWEFNGTDWAQVTTSQQPTAVYGMSMAYDSSQNKTILFGGSDSTDAELAETWQYDGSNWTQLTPATSPPARTNHTLVYDAIQNKTYLFGGNDGIIYFNDVWAFDGTNWSQVTVSGTSPVARTLHVMATNTTENKLYLFGGRAVSGSELADLWVFDPASSSWTEITATGPVARQAHGLTYDVGKQKLVLVSGVANAGDIALNDTWLYDSSGWQLVSAPGIGSDIAYHTLVYDSTNNRIILFTNAETWIYE